METNFGLSLGIENSGLVGAASTGKNALTFKLRQILEFLLFAVMSQLGLCRSGLCTVAVGYLSFGLCRSGYVVRVYHYVFRDTVGVPYLAHTVHQTAPTATGCTVLCGDSEYFLGQCMSGSFLVFLKLCPL